MSRSRHLRAVRSLRTKDRPSQCRREQGSARRRLGPIARAPQDDQKVGFDSGALREGHMQAGPQVAPVSHGLASYREKPGGAEPCGLAAAKKYKAEFSEREHPPTARGPTGAECTVPPCPNIEREVAKANEDSVTPPCVLWAQSAEPQADTEGTSWGLRTMTSQPPAVPSAGGE